jgi:hypothetical protein
MPRGPKGEKRHANTVDNAMLIGRIATGDVEDVESVRNPDAVNLGRLGGLKGGKARAKKLSPRKRSAIAKKAAQSRWRNP